MEMFTVGGFVRDEILGVKSKDIDFSVVLSDSEVGISDPFEVMVVKLKDMGFKIFLETPEFLTVRARFPGTTKSSFGLTSSQSGFGTEYDNLTADFVLARKESGYEDGRRPDAVEVGTLEDDLARRDFTMNAIAKDADGTLIDPFDGVQDINDRVIRAVGNAFDRLTEDALRAVRALRFSVTKGFRIDHELMFAMQSAAVLDAIRNKISDERIDQELSKMLKFDTMESLRAFQTYPLLTAAMFSGRVSLASTMKTKGRGNA